MTHVTAPIILLGGAATLIIIIVCVYLLAYRAHINRALKNGGERPMAAPRTVLAVSAVIVLLCAATLGFAAGYKAAYDDFEDIQDIELPAITLRDLSRLPELFDAALEHAGVDGAELENAHVALADLSFLKGGLGYFSFELYYDKGSERIMRIVDVTAAGAVYADTLPSGNAADGGAMPLAAFRSLLAALDGVDWPEGGDYSGFDSLSGTAEPAAGGYLLEGGALVPAPDGGGECRVLSYISGEEYLRIYVPLE